MYEYEAQLNRVVDGDTIDVTIDLGFGIYRRDRIRLVGINTPERGQPKWAEATLFVKQWFEEHGTRFVLFTRKDQQEKYGRYLGTVVPHDLTGSLNTALVDAGLAELYL